MNGSVAPFREIQKLRALSREKIKFSYPFVNIEKKICQYWLTMFRKLFFYIFSSQVTITSNIIYNSVPPRASYL